MFKTRLGRIIAAAICIVPIVTLVGLSFLYPTYGEICERSADGPKEICVSHSFLPFLLIQFYKILPALEGIVVTLAAIATAYFTQTIWRVNARQLAHSQKIERAYMSGGGYRAKQPTAISAYGHPVLSETGEFDFCVNNYGKTPGTLYKLGYGFCDESAIPTVPKYIPQYRHNQIDPGRSGEPIARHPIPQEYKRPVVYGRFYYETIFGTRHSSGFLYRILPNQGSESIPPPSTDYIRDQDEQ
jgi:hypothetical protein